VGEKEKEYEREAVLRVGRLAQAGRCDGGVQRKKDGGKGAGEGGGGTRVCAGKGRLFYWSCKQLFLRSLYIAAGYPGEKKKTLGDKNLKKHAFPGVIGRLLARSDNPRRRPQMWGGGSKKPLEGP